MIGKLKVYLKRYFFIIPIIVYCSVVLTHLTDHGTITRVNKHDIHCDPNRIAIQLLKEDDLFKLPLEIPDSLSNKIKQIDLCIGTNGNNDNKVELILNTKNNGTFYYNNNIDDNKYISLIKGSKNNTLEENFIYVKSNELKNCALWAKKIETKDFNTWKINQKGKFLYPIIYALEHPSLIYTNIDKIVYLWGINKYIILGIIALSFVAVIYSSKEIHGGNLKYFALLALSIMMQLSIFFPPLMQADEPQHLISYLTITNQNEKIKEVLKCSQKSHFTRMLFNEQEKFTSLDVDNFSHSKLPEKVKSSQVENRSFLTPIMWKCMSIFIDELTVTKQILAIRILHSVVFCICIYFCINKFNFNLYVLFCSIPTLLCVSTAVSNYVISFALLFLIINQTLKNLSDNNHKNRIVCILMISFLSFESISFIFLIPLFLFLNTPPSSNRFYIFFVIINSSIYLLNDFTFGLKFSSLFESSQTRFLFFIISNILIFKLISYLYLRLPIINLNNFFNKYYYIIIISSIFSYILLYPTNMDIENSSIKYSNFIISLLSVVICWFRLENPDFLSQTTLFTGFGWLDFDKSFLSVIINYFIFLIFPFINYEIKNKIQSNAFLFYTLIFSVTIILLCTSLYFGNVNPHGRYYLSYFYTFLLLLFIYIRLPLLKNNFLIKIKSNVNVITVTYFLLVYSFSISLCFDRYF
jgi:hypothetical protein